MYPWLTQIRTAAETKDDSLFTYFDVFWSTSDYRKMTLIWEFLSKGRREKLGSTGKMCVLAN